MVCLKKLLWTICYSSMQTYYLCILLLGLFGTCIYFHVYTTASIASPHGTCLNEHLYYSDRNLSGSGFVMALDYSDQLTGSGMNLFCLQCLAYSIDPSLVVVEPFVVQSTFGVAINFHNPPPETPWKGNAVRMSDIYDVGRWLAFAKEKCYAPLVSWGSLLDLAPRNVVLVQHTWSNECSLEAFRSNYSVFFLLYGFTVVREVCFNFKSTGQLELWRYKHSIYGDLDPNSVTLLYQKWLGVGEKVEKFTVGISDSECEKERINHPMFNGLHVAPSGTLRAQADKYITQYLGGVSDNMYIAVMFRMEQVFVSTSKKVNKLSLVSRCITNIIKKWQYMKKETEITQTFLTLDYGKFGSKGFAIHKYVDLNALEGKLSGLLGAMEQGTFHEWESKIQNVAGTENPGYIASLQRTIAGRARCLITAGAGAFQNHAFVMHRKLYKKTCHIRLKTNCRLMDSFIKLPKNLNA